MRESEIVQMALQVIDSENLKVKKNPEPSGGAEWGCLKFWGFVFPSFLFAQAFSHHRNRHGFTVLF